MDQNKNKASSKKLLSRIKKMMKENKMRWKDASNFFGFESQTTVHSWFDKEEIPRSRHLQVDLMLKQKKY